jgi:hypothetical protein
VEILLIIFLFSDFGPVPSSERPIEADEAWKRARLLVEASSVCSRFYGVLRAASEFWNIIIFTPMRRTCDTDIVKQIIRRSGERPVHVVWDCRGHLDVMCTPCVDALRLVNTARICTISIRLTSRGASPTAVVFDSLIPLKSLHSSHVECHEGCSEVPFIPCGPLTTFLTITPECCITNLNRHVKVNLPLRLATTLVSLRIHISISTADLNHYLGFCRALLHLEWEISSSPSLDEEDGDMKQHLFLPPTVKNIVVSHPILVPLLHAPSLTHAKLDIHDHDQIEVTPWEEWNIDTIHVPRLKSLWLSCPCIATNGLLEGMVESSAEELEELNLGVQMRCPKGVLCAANALRRFHTPRLRSISFGIWPHSHFHGMWGRVATRLANLLTERDTLRVHCAFFLHHIPTPIEELVEQYRIVPHVVRDFSHFRETMKYL